MTVRSKVALATSIVVASAWLANDALAAEGLRRVGGLRLSEIGRRMNVSLATVKRRLAAAEDRFAACQHPLERIAGYAGRRAPAPAR